jgi:hypothetical protein
MTARVAVIEFLPNEGAGTQALAAVHDAIPGDVLDDGQNVLDSAATEAARSAYVGIGRRAADYRRRVTD